MTLAYPGQKAIRFGLALTVLSLLGLAAVYVIAIEHTPTEIRQGLAGSSACFTSGCRIPDSSSSPPRRWRSGWCSAW